FPAHGLLLGDALSALELLLEDAPLAHGLLLGAALSTLELLLEDAPLAHGLLGEALPVLALYQDVNKGFAPVFGNQPIECLLEKLEALARRKHFLEVQE